MSALEDGVVELSLGDEHGCARRSDGRVLCWGDNARGQLGQADLTTNATSPELVPGIEGARQIAAGSAHSCALLDVPGQVMCWGRNDNGQLGHGEVSDAPIPQPDLVPELDDAVEVIAGGNHTCARRSDGSVACWGYNYLGALGNGSTRPTRSTSLQEVIGIEDAVQLAAGQHFTCALRANGTVSCWGDNGHGQLGDGTTSGSECDGRSCRTSPGAVEVVRDAVLIDAGYLHACAATEAGQLWCWGYNLGGQIGTGMVTSDPIATPAEVEGLPR
jgi:alpha-tubulin suppressor-like RCC1 family protein